MSGEQMVANLIMRLNIFPMQTMLSKVRSGNTLASPVASYPGVITSFEVNDILTLRKKDNTVHKGKEQISFG